MIKATFPAAIASAVDAFYEVVQHRYIEQCTLATLPAKTRLTIKGDEAKNCYYLLDGKINVLNQFENGKDFLYVRIGPGSVIGEMEVASGRKLFISTLECATPCNVIVFSAQTYLKWFYENSDFARRAAERMANMLCISAYNNGASAAFSASENIALLLIGEYCNQGNHGTLQVRDTRSSIAKRTGVCVRTVHRIIHSFEEQHFLQVEDGKVIISPDCFARLQSYADGFLYNYNMAHQ